MFVHSSSRFQKLSNTDIDNLTYKEARQIANYARNLISKRINYLNKKGFGFLNSDLFFTERKTARDEQYDIYPIPQNESISFYKDFIKKMKFNYKDTSVDAAFKKLERVITEKNINITLEKLKYLYVLKEEQVSSSSEMQTFVDNEFSGDWDTYWKSYIPYENIENIIVKNTEYPKLKKIIEGL